MSVVDAIERLFSETVNRYGDDKTGSLRDFCLDTDVSNEDLVTMAVIEEWALG